jgi:hypothetical protein
LVIYNKNQTQVLCPGCSDGNDELIIGNDVFQLDELVDPYRVALSNDLKENSIFCVAENTLVDVDVDELNDALRTSRHT